MSLTTSSDTVIGQSGDDVIIGALANNGASDTYQTWDVIDGGAGTNTLNVEVSAGTYNATLANIQNMNIQQASSATAAATFGLNGLASLQNLSLIGPQGFAVNNLGSVPNISISGTTANTTLIFNASALSPSAQTLSLALNGVNSTVTLQDVGANALETLAITANGSSSNIGNLTFGTATNALGTTTTTIAGSANLTMSVVDAFSAMRTINGTQATGSLNLTVLASSTVTTGSGNDTVTSGGGTDNFTGGAGNDRFVFAAGFLTNQDTVDGGDGTGDAIWTTTADAENYATVTPKTINNIEVLSLTDVGALANLVTQNIATGISTVELQAGTNGASTITMGAGTATVNIGRTGNAGAQTLGGLLTVNDTGVASTDSLTITNNAFLAGANVNAFNGQAIAVNGYETVTVNTGTATSVATNTTGTITLAADAGADTNLTILGNQTLTTDQITATNINASALVGSDSLALSGTTLAGVRGLVMGAAAAEGLTSITGSAYADFLRGDNSSSIAGGAGNDSIIGGAGNDSLHGEAGNDTITSGTGNDLIEGGSGNDTIIFTTGQLTANDTVNAGEGAADVLRYNSFTAADNNSNAQARVSNFEFLRMEGSAGAAVAVTLSNYANNTGFERIQLGNNGANGYDFQAAGSNLNNISAVAAAAGSHLFDRLVDTTTDTLTVQNATTLVGGASTITALTALDEETITLTATVPTVAGANDLTIGTLTVGDLTTLNITSASDVIITNAIAGTFNLATVNASTATGAVTVNASNSGSAVTMTGNASSAGVITFTGGGFADVISGGAAADVLTGNAGADSITAGAGADLVTGGTGADLVSLGSDGDVDTVVQNVADSQVSTATSFAGATVAAGDTITFGNSVDQVTGFVAGATGDQIRTIVAGGPTVLIGANQNALANGVYIASGTYNATTGVFTIQNDIVDGTAGPDTLILQATGGTAASTVVATNANMMILTGVRSSDLVAGNFTLGANAVALTGTYNAGVFTLTSSTTVNGTVSISQAGVVSSTDGAAVVTQPTGFVQANLTSFSLAGLTTTGGTISNFDGGVSTGLSAVTGSAGNDIFVFATAVFGAAAATVNGSGGTDTLRFSSYGTDVVGDAGAGIVSIENIELAAGATQLTMDNTVATAVAISNTSTANAAATVLLGTGAAHSFTALSTNTGTQTITIGQNGQNVTTGAGTDDIRVGTTGLALTGTLTGNGGADTLTAAVGNGGTLDLSGATLSGLETLRWNGNETSNVTIDEANLAVFTTAITGGGDAETLTLSKTGSGVFDFSGTALTAVATVATVGSDVALTFQAADLNNVTTLTIGTAASTDISLTDADDLSGITITDGVRSLNFGNFIMTLDADNVQSDFLALNGNSGAASQITTSGDTAFTFGEKLSGVSILDTTTGADDDISIGGSSLAGLVTLTGHAGSALVISSNATNVSTSITAGDFDAMTLGSGVSVTANTSFYSTSQVAFAGDGAGAAETFTYNLANTGVTFTLAAISSVTNLTLTVNDGTGNDTITTADSAAGQLMFVDLGRGGNDTVVINVETDVAANNTIIGNQTVTNFGTTDVLDLVDSAGNGVSTVRLVNAAGVWNQADDGLAIISSALGTLADPTALAAAENFFETIFAGNINNAAIAANDDVYIAAYTNTGSLAIYQVNLTNATGNAFAIDGVEYIATLTGLGANGWTAANFS